MREGEAEQQAVGRLYGPESRPVNKGMYQDHCAIPVLRNCYGIACARVCGRRLRELLYPNDLADDGLYGGPWAVWPQGAGQQDARQRERSSSRPQWVRLVVACYWEQGAEPEIKGAVARLRPVVRPQLVTSFTLLDSRREASVTQLLGIVTAVPPATDPGGGSRGRTRGSTQGPRPPSSRDDYAAAA